MDIAQKTVADLLGHYSKQVFVFLCLCLKHYSNDGDELAEGLRTLPAEILYMICGYVVPYPDQFVYVIRHFVAAFQFKRAIEDLHQNPFYMSSVVNNERSLIRESLAHMYLKVYGNDKPLGHHSSVEQFTGSLRLAHFLLENFSVQFWKRPTWRKFVDSFPLNSKRHYYTDIFVNRVLRQACKVQVTYHHHLARRTLSMPSLLKLTSVFFERHEVNATYANIEAVMKVVTAYKKEYPERMHAHTIE